ncbi:CPBP family intramembrane glutamic endopeptidase [Paenibacillus sp. S-38]|uniref:CPBP family intramembrane glutamic endopeptidase n=1 Tax=Paenibacillus sp. S-38 TaxID=3416710 RepID=UPI003CF8A7BE
MKRNLPLTLLLTLLGTLGAIAILPYQLALLGGSLPDPGGLPLPASLALGVAQQAVLLFIVTSIGVRLQKRTALDIPLLRAWITRTQRPPVSLAWMAGGIAGSLIGCVVIALLDAYLFTPAITASPTEHTLRPSWWQSLLTMFYGGVTEELMLRLFAMTLFVWLLAKLTGKSGERIPSVYYWTAVLLSTLLFGIGHLPAASGLYGTLSGMIVARILILNGLLGIWFGYLYWKKGLEYAMVSHMSADLFLHVVFPSIFD